ncbi:hypothetical protein D3C76_1117050 [compost metagenome]
MLPLAEPHLPQVMQGRGIVRFDAQGTLQRIAGLLHLAEFQLQRRSLQHRGRRAVVLLGRQRRQRSGRVNGQHQGWHKALGVHRGRFHLISDRTLSTEGDGVCWLAAVARRHTRAEQGTAVNSDPQGYPEVPAEQLTAIETPPISGCASRSFVRCKVWPPSPLNPSRVARRTALNRPARR